MTRNTTQPSVALKGALSCLMRSGLPQLRLDLNFFNRKSPLQTGVVQFENMHLMGQKGSHERHY